MNRQDSNVGNLGDVAKHVAWIALCQAIEDASDNGSIVAIDTHAYRLGAPVGNPILLRALHDFGAAVSARSMLGTTGTSRALDDFDNWQADAFRGAARYVCSPGLALRALPRHRTAYFWAEADASTRRDLEAAAAEEAHGAMSCRIFPAASAIASAVDVQGSVAILFDPFTFDGDRASDRALWRSVEEVATRALAPAAPGFLLAFRYVREPEPERDTLPRMSSPCWSRKPIALWSQGPFHLAVYTTPEFEPHAVEALRPIGGWRHGRRRRGQL